MLSLNIFFCSSINNIYLFCNYLRKVSKAAIALVPLLGITNFILVILPEPHAKSPELFAFWSYTAHILHSSQGLMVSILYCFMNKEVSI